MSASPDLTTNIIRRINELTGEMTARFISIIKLILSPASLQVLMPGETNDPTQPSGKSGTPSARTAGTAFNVVVNIVDGGYNILTAFTDTVAIASSDVNATLPSNAALVAGVGTFSVTLKTAGSKTVTATDVTDSSILTNTGSSTTVNSGAFAKLQVLMPNEVAAPGTATGKVGSVIGQALGVACLMITNAVDANWNLVNTVTDTVALTSTDTAATSP